MCVCVCVCVCVCERERERERQAVLVCVNLPHLMQPPSLMTDDHVNCFCFVLHSQWLIVTMFKFYWNCYAVMQLCFT